MTRLGKTYPDPDAACFVCSYGGRCGCRVILANDNPGALSNAHVIAFLKMPAGSSLYASPRTTPESLVTG